jgi:hypothetical protein
MYYEAIGKVERAEGFYNDILEAQPHNDVIPKRLVGKPPHQTAAASSSSSSDSSSVPRLSRKMCRPALQ